jgi:hypothetical protein
MLFFYEGKHVQNIDYRRISENNINFNTSIIFIIYKNVYLIEKRFSGLLSIKQW